MLNITQRTIIDRILKEKNNFVDFVTEEIKDPKLVTYNDYVNYKENKDLNDNVYYIDGVKYKGENLYGDATKYFDPSEIVYEDDVLRSMYDKVREILTNDENIDCLKSLINQKRKEIKESTSSIDVDKATKEIDIIESLINQAMHEKKEGKDATSDDYSKSILALINYILESKSFATLIDDPNFDYDKAIKKYYERKKNDPTFKNEIKKYEDANDNGIYIKAYDMIVVANSFLSTKHLNNQDIEQLVTYINKNANLEAFIDEDFLSEYNLLINNLEERIGHISHKLLESALKEKYGSDYVDYLENKSKILDSKRKEIQEKKHIVMGTIPLTKNLVLNIQVDRKSRKKEKRKLSLNKDYKKEKRIISPEIEKYRSILSDITRKVMDKNTTYEEIEECQKYLLCIDTNDPAIKGKVYRLLGKLNVRLHSCEKEIGKITKQIDALNEWSKELTKYDHFDSFEETLLKKEMNRYSESVSVLKKIYEDRQEQIIEANKPSERYNRAKEEYRCSVHYDRTLGYCRQAPSRRISNRTINDEDEIRKLLLERETDKDGLKHYRKSNLSDVKTAFVVDSSNFRLSSVHRSEDRIVRSPIAISIEHTEYGKILSIYVINSAPFMQDETVKYLEEKFFLYLKDDGALRDEEYTNLSKLFYFNDNCDRPTIEYKFTLDNDNRIAGFSVEQCDIKTRVATEDEKDDLRDIYLTNRNKCSESLEQCFERITSQEFIKYSFLNNLPILCCGKFVKQNKEKDKKKILKQVEEEIVNRLGRSFDYNITDEDIKRIAKDYYHNKYKTHFRTDSFSNDYDGEFEFNKLNILHPYIFTNYFNQCVINSAVFGNIFKELPKQLRKKQSQYTKMFNEALDVIDNDTQIKIMKNTLDEHKVYKIGSI